MTPLFGDFPTVHNAKISKNSLFGMSSWRGDVTERMEEGTASRASARP